MKHRNKNKITDDLAQEMEYGISGPFLDPLLSDAERAAMIYLEATKIVSRKERKHSFQRKRLKNKNNDS